MAESTLTRPTGSRAGARRRELWRNIEGYIFASPFVIGFVWFALGPFAASLYLAFTQYEMKAELPAFVGLQNFQDMAADADLRRSLVNTVYYTVAHVPGTLILAFFIALLLNQKVKGMPLYRTMFFVPSVVAGVATAILWLFLLDTNWGLINTILVKIGGETFRVPWLTSTRWAMPSLILMSFWRLGAPMIIFLAALQGVPEHLYEAAEIDGAGRWAKIRHVTIPQLTPTIFLLTVLNIIGSFQVFTDAFIITEGGPAGATLVYLLHLYRQAFRSFHMGYGAAMGWFLFMIVLILTMIQLWLSRRWVYYEAAMPGQKVGGA